MKSFFKHWRLSLKLWNQLSHHVFMNHWKAAGNVCQRIDHMKADRIHIRILMR